MSPTRLLLITTLIYGFHLSAEETVEFTSRAKSQPSIILPQPTDKDTIRVISYDNQIFVEIVIASDGDRPPMRLIPESYFENIDRFPSTYKALRIPSRIDLSEKLFCEWVLESRRRRSES